MVAKALLSSKSEEWYTPKEIFDSLKKEFNFTLDVCATAENTKCKRFFTKSDDGLFQNWVNDGGDIWMNPPYGRQISGWVEKAKVTGSFGSTVVALLPSRTDTRWFHQNIWNRHTNRPMLGIEVRFLKGRLKFGGSKNSAPFPSMIVVFR